MKNVDPMEVAHIDAFRSDPVRFWSFYGQRFATLGGKPPTARTARSWQWSSAGCWTRSSPRTSTCSPQGGTRALVEVHGSIASCSCLVAARASSSKRCVRACARRRTAFPAASAARTDEADVVLFGELLPAGALDRARELCARADVLLCIGSSLEVHPVAALPLMTHAAGGALAILTQGATPLDALAEVRVHGDVVAELERLLVALDAGVQ